MGIYAKVIDGIVDNIVFSFENLEDTDIETYIDLEENREGIAVGEAYDAATGFTTFKNEVITLDRFQENNVAADNPAEVTRRKEIKARAWRNRKLKETDWATSISDHPNAAAYTTYRSALRNWPASADFPDTPPVL